MSGQNNSRLAGLEILRFISALAVLLWHYSMFAFYGDKIEGFERETLPFYWMLQWVYERGFYAVQYFWCISGFIFFWKYQTPIRNGLGGYKFFMLRFSRLYPLHLATLIIVAALQLVAFHFLGGYQIFIENTFTNFIMHLFMLGNLQFPNHMSFNGPIWSVSVEVLVYFTFYWLCRSIRNSTAAAFIIAAIAIPTHLETGAVIQVVACASFFYLGGIACATYRFLDQFNCKTPAALILCVAYIWYWFHSETIPISGNLRLVIVIPLVVLLLGVAPFFNTQVVQRVAECGNLTYALYLLHTPVTLLIIIGYRANGFDVPYHSSIFFLMFYSALILMAALTYAYFEAPIQNLFRSTFIARRSDKFG